jgi:hypothetical protein
MGESSGSVSIDVERISFGGQVFPFSLFFPSVSFLLSLFSLVFIFSSLYVFIFRAEIC